MVRVLVSLPGGQLQRYEIYRDIGERKRAEEELRASRAQLRDLAARWHAVREEERTRVAREIHDVLGQALAVIRSDLTRLIDAASAGKGVDTQRAHAVLRLLDDTIQAARRIATELRPAILDDLGLAAAVERATHEFHSRTGMTGDISVPEEDIAIDRDRATAAFRIFQEMLT